MSEVVTHQISLDNRERCSKHRDKSYESEVSDMFSRDSFDIMKVLVHQDIGVEQSIVRPSKEFRVIVSKRISIHREGTIVGLLERIPYLATICMKEAFKGFP